jgi:dTMP kinase
MKMAHSTTRFLCRKIVMMPFITFEGSEGCGKTTQVKQLANHLEKIGIVPEVFREPGGTLIGEAIRHLLQHSDENHAMTSEAELLLFEASRSQLIHEKIQPALKRGDWVVCDRFFDSTTVYQGAARKLDPALVERLNSFVAGNCVPDLTFVLDVDRATARSRLSARTIRDRMEEQPEDFYERVRSAYRELARRDAGRVTLVDGSRHVGQIATEIWRIVTQRFALDSEIRPSHSAR